MRKNKKAAELIYNQIPHVNNNFLGTLAKPDLA